MNCSSSLTGWANGIDVPINLYTFQGAGGLLLTDNMIQTMFDDFNEIFIESGLRVNFYLRCNNNVTDPTFFNVDIDNEFDDLVSTHHISTGIDVYLVNTAVTRGIAVGGVYSSIHDRFLLTRTNVRFSGGETFAHEAGHMFGLEHPHRSTNLDPNWAPFDGLDVSCEREFVTRVAATDQACLPLAPRTCSMTGDGFCDTPADTNSQRNPGGRLVDPDGDTYTPDRTNVMSYYNNADRFSPQQIDAIYYDLLRRASSGWSNGSTFWVQSGNGQLVPGDQFEPDNVWDIARAISVNESQTHTLHSTDLACLDEDWIEISGDATNPQQGNVTITVESIPGCTTPISNIMLLQRVGSTFNTIATATYNGGSTSFSHTLSCSDFAQGSYFLNVDGSNTAGEYEVQTSIDAPTISNENNIACDGVNVQINGTSESVEVEWSTSPAVNFSASGTEFTLGSSPANGSVNVMATVTEGDCVYELQTFLQETTDGPVPDFELEVYGDEFCFPDNPATIVVRPIASGVTYEWELLNGYGTFNFLYEPYVAELHPQDPHTYTVRVTAIRENTCSDLASQVREVTVSYTDCQTSGLVVYPNPTSGEVTIESDAFVSGIGRTIRIENQYGVEVFQNQTDQSSSTIDVSEFEEGIYFIQVLSGKYIRSVTIHVVH